MSASGEVFDELLERGQIVLHASEVERTAALAAIGAAIGATGADRRTGSSSPTPATRSVRSTQPSATAATAPTSSPLSLPVSLLVSPSPVVVSGSVSATESPPDATTATSPSPTETPGPWPGSARTGPCSSPAAPANATLPAEYVREHVELAFTTTAYGAQGETVDVAHLALSEKTSAASAYVGMTRGRHHNVAHLVAESIDEARSQWVDIFNRDRADLGPNHAAERAADDIDRYGPSAPPFAIGLQAAALQAATSKSGPRRPPEPIPGPPRVPPHGIGR